MTIMQLLINSSSPIGKAVGVTSQYKKLKANLKKHKKTK